VTYRNKKLLELARNHDCVNCGADDGTIVACHANLLELGKGRGLKASDAAVSFLCFTCHAALDQGTGDKLDKRSFTYEMIAKTLIRLVEEGTLRIK
jgi:ribosomal protein S27AE